MCSREPRWIVPAAPEDMVKGRAATQTFTLRMAIWVTRGYWDESNEVHPRHPDELR